MAEGVGFAVASTNRIVINNGEVDEKVGQNTRKKYNNNINILQKQNGAPGRIRTRDPLITNQVLYQLS